MTTLTEVFTCFVLSCKANGRVKPTKTGHGPHSSQLLCCSMYFLCCYMYFCVHCIVCFVTFPVLFVCIYVLYYCHRVATQVQLNIYHVISSLAIRRCFLFSLHYQWVIKYTFVWNLTLKYRLNKWYNLYKTYGHYTRTRLAISKNKCLNKAVFIFIFTAAPTLLIRKIFCFLRNQTKNL
jgi:hypothetical protein